MQVPSVDKDGDDYLDIFGQQPSLNHLNTQICSCFSVTDDVSHDFIIKTLTTGLERLYTRFPWLASQVVNEDAGEGSSGIFKFKAMEAASSIVIKDLSDDPSMSTMETFRQAGFPFSMLDENLIAPRNTLPGSSDDSPVGPEPVLLLQATFITGGLLLTFLGQHQAMDMTGQSHIINLFSKACHDESFTREELRYGNLSRHRLVPLVEDSHTFQPDHQIQKPAPSQPTPEGTNVQGTAPHSPPCTWVYFNFDFVSLAALKSLATETMPASSRYISTDDALSALIWQAISRTRLSRANIGAESTFARAVDVRQYLGISPLYPGLVQNMTYHTYNFEKLVREPLGSIASRLRLAVDPETSRLGHDTCSLATMLERTSDKSMISITATLDLSSDVMLSSWAKFNLHELDFNLRLGRPVAVRRPRFTPVESLIYLMPKTPEGEIAVAVCLREDDIERLKTDEQFMRYAKYVG